MIETEIEVWLSKTISNFLLILSVIMSYEYYAYYFRNEILIG